MVCYFLPRVFYDFEIRFAWEVMVDYSFKID